MNYQKLLDQKLKEIQEKKERPKLLLHSCCAPCSSYVIEILSCFFDIILFYYNPNIQPYKEYRKRVEEQKEFLKKAPFSQKVKFVEGKYEDEKFQQIVKGKEEEKEGGSRCFLCYEFRLKAAAQKAVELGCDYFTTTLSISPYKNARKINEIGENISKNVDVAFLYGDFKKKDGYKRSIELSKIYNLYRQDYCGCIYSKLER